MLALLCLPRVPLIRRGEHFSFLSFSLLYSPASLLHLSLTRLLFSCHYSAQGRTTLKAHLFKRQNSMVSYSVLFPF